MYGDGEKAVPPRDGHAAVLRELRVARGLELLAEENASFGDVAADVRTQVAAELPA